MSLNKSKALRTAEKYVLQGKIPAAIDEYRKVVNADPGDLTTINTLGDLYVRAGRIQDAISNFSRIADSYREGGFTLKAIAMLKKISKLDPTNVDTAMKLANLYSQQGLLVEARQQYLQVADAYARAGQTRKALEAYQKIADLDPSNTSVRMKLGEIYSRERMTDQAHEAFIIAGAEFLRKGDTELALNANLKAIVINPDSRQALTAIATIYTQQGQIDRAINILCEAFERNPGDVELLTILGRTYLSAGMMDDAERTFLSLVELDKNRYHYLLEVGRRFLQIGDLDRAAEQIDGSIDVLIAKREEDKAIDFLRRVLDRDIYHIGALKRLSQIFLRIREDHNLIATLNSLAEAAMRKGADEEAIVALKELARLEPDEPLHLQRLYTLGVTDIVEADHPDVVRATGPLDYRSRVFDDAFVIRQISEAEILAGHGQVDHAVEILTEILRHAPENVQVHMKLKDIYLRAGIMDRAAEQCLELARIHDTRGEGARASDFSAEARQLNPLLDVAAVGSSSVVSAPSPALVEEVAPPVIGASGNGGGGGFEVTESGGLDWSRYQTGTLSDSGFVTVPEEITASGGSGHESSREHPSDSAIKAGTFKYSDNVVSDNGHESDAPPVADAVFNSASLLPSDTMPSLLRDELEGIDFYIAQGYSDIAKDTLDRLRDENGEHPEILARYKRLGVRMESEPASGNQPAFHDESVVEFDAADLPLGGSFEEAMPVEERVASKEAAITSFEALEVVSAGEPEVGVDAANIQADPEPESEEEQPFLIQKESGPLYPDLLVQLNTSELSNQPAYEAFRSSIENTPPAPVMPPVSSMGIGTGDLIESIVSSIETTFDRLPQPDEQILETSESPEEDDQPIAPNLEAPVDQEVEPAMPAEASFADLNIGYAMDPSADVAQPVDEASLLHHNASENLIEPEPRTSRSSRDELQEIFDELKEKTGDLRPLVDFETHYSLGLAYKDMDLLDDAISEFQMAFRTAGESAPEADFIQCCNMLGVCFKRKQLFKVAVMWFERGLKIRGRSEDEYQALRFEIGLCYEEMGNVDKAIEVFTDVYGIDVNYRKVGQKIRQLQALRA